MGKYFLENECVRVSFDDGNWVEIKEELTQEDQDFILNDMAKAMSADKKTQVTMKLGRLALLQRSVVAWSFRDDSDKPIPVTKDNISKLRLRYRIKVLSEIDRLISEANEFMQKNAEGAST